MAKSSWLTVSPTSGFGNKTIQNVGTSHTGRLDRQTVVTGRAIGISTTKTYTVTQKAKSEFITIGAASYSVVNTGGIVTVSGTSNSPKLTVSVGSGGTLGTLVVNGSTVTNGSAISGDPGATAQYSWSIQIQVGENLTAVQRAIDVSVTGSSASVADTVQIVQAASVFEYEFSIAAGTASLPASGGNSAITAQLTTKRNGKKISTRAVTPTLSGSGTGFSISGTTVTAANRGTTVGEARSITVTGKFTTSETGETLSDTAVVSQAANSRVIVYSKPNITDVSAADIPASGGSVSSASVSYSQSRHYYYDSGATEELSALTTGGTIDYGTAVSGSNLGTTVKERIIVGQLTFTVSMNGQTSVEDNVSIYQAKNIPTAIAVTTHNYSYPTGAISAGGGTKVPTASSGVTITFSSGATKAEQSGDKEGYILTPVVSYSIVATTGFSINTSSGVITAADRTTVEGVVRSCGNASRKVVWTCKIDSTYGGGTLTTENIKTLTAPVSQEANTATYGNITLTANNPSAVAATGGTATISASASQTVSFTSGSTRAGSVSIAYKEKSAVSGFTLSGNKVTVGANSSTSSRSYVVTVTATGEGSKSATKDVTVSQAAGTITYSDIVLTVTYPTIGAGGGTVRPTVSYTQTWGYNGSTTGGGTITSGGSVTYSGTSVSTSDGAVTAGTKGTTASGVTTVTTATVSVSLNGKSASKQVAVQQAANAITAYGTVSISGGTVSDIPASGGSVSSMSGISASQTITYTSGSTRPGSVSITYSTKVEAGSLGTTIKNRASVGTLTATATGEGSKSATKSVTVYQAGNYVTAIDLTGFAVLYSKSVSAGGGTVSPSVTGGSVKFTFTSGSTTTTTPSSTYGSLSSATSYSGSAANGFSAPNSSSGSMTASDRATTEGAARNSGTVTATKKVTWTPTSSYNSAGTKTDSMSDTDYATQEANVKTAGSISYGAWQVSVSANRYTTSSSPCPAAGGTCTITASATRTRTQNYSFTSGDTTTEALSNESGSPTLSISGTGASLSGTTVTWANRTTTTGEVRSATVTAKMDSVTATEVVYQQANSYSDSYNNPVISRPNASHNFTKSGGTWASGVSVSQSGTRTYTSGSTTALTGSASFTLSESASWLTTSGGSITASANSASTSRSATVTINATGSGGKTATSTISITQDAGVYLNVSPTSLSFEATGGTKTITIDTNESWTIS